MNRANGSGDKVNSPGLKGHPCLDDLATGKSDEQILPAKIIADGAG